MENLSLDASATWHWSGDGECYRPQVPLMCAETANLTHGFCAFAAQGKQLVFVTNNSTKSRKGYLGKFTGLGLNVAAEEIYSSSYAAAAYLESINFPKDKKVCLTLCTIISDFEQRVSLLNITVSPKPRLPQHGPRCKPEETPIQQ